MILPFPHRSTRLVPADGWGAIGLYRGAPDVPLNAPTWSLHFHARSPRARGSGLTACDVDGDGARDLIVRTEASHLVTFEVYTSIGLLRPDDPAWIIRDPEGQGTRHEENWTPYAACAGDLDGDGDEEVAVGDHTFANDRGRVYVFDFR